MWILRELFGVSPASKQETSPQPQKIDKRHTLTLSHTMPVAQVHSPSVEHTARTLSHLDRYQVFNPADALRLHYRGVSIEDRLDAGRLGSDLLLAFGGETVTGYEGLLVGLTPSEIAAVMGQVAPRVQGQVTKPQDLAVLQGELPGAQNERQARAALQHLFHLSSLCVQTAYFINQVKIQMNPQVTFDPKSLGVEFDDTQPGFRAIAYPYMDEEERQHRARFREQDLLTVSQPVFLRELGATLDAEPAWQEVWQQHPEGMHLLRQMASFDAELVKELIHQFQSITRTRVL